MAIILHAVLNASGRLWSTLPEYSAEPPSAAEAAAQIVHIDIVMTIVLWVAAVVLVLIYGPRNLSRCPRQVLSAASAEPKLGGRRPYGRRAN
jgi:hypothetical protein